MPFDEPVSDAHRLINAKKHDQESKGQLDGQWVAELLNEGLTVSCFELGQLERAAKEQHAEGAHLKRIVQP